MKVKKLIEERDKPNQFVGFFCCFVLFLCLFVCFFLNFVIDDIIVLCVGGGAGVWGCVGF